MPEASLLDKIHSLKNYSRRKLILFSIASLETFQQHFHPFQKHFLAKLTLFAEQPTVCYDLFLDLKWDDMRYRQGTPLELLFTESLGDICNLYHYQLPLFSVGNIVDRMAFLTPDSTTLNSLFEDIFNNDHTS